MIQEKKETKNKKGNFNIWAALFGIFYYSSKGLWKKGLLLSSLILFIAAIAQLVFPTTALNSLLSLGLNIGLFGALANGDIQRKEEENETVWKELPYVFHQNWLVIGTFVFVFIFSIAIEIASTSEIEEDSTDIVSEVLNDQCEIL